VKNTVFLRHEESSRQSVRWLGVVTIGWGKKSKTIRERSVSLGSDNRNIGRKIGAKRTSTFSHALKKEKQEEGGTESKRKE